MAVLNRPVTSREYKLMLNPELFADRKVGIEMMRDLVRILVQVEKGSFEKQDEIKRRLTWYLDTKAGDLRRERLALRMRRELPKKNNGGNGNGEKYKATLKYRSEDRYLSANAPVAAREGSKPECKFEEDITPPWVGRYSHSSTVEYDAQPDLGDLGKACDHFPGLGELLAGVDSRTDLKVVRDFKARELTCHLGTAHFPGNPDAGCVDLPVRFCVNFWYEKGQCPGSAGDDPDSCAGVPKVVELSFDFDLVECDKADRKCRGDGQVTQDLERFPLPVVKACNALFRNLVAMESWLLAQGTTKTALAYEGV